MKIKMKVEISGSRNGQSWPGKGEIMDLPDAEAAQLCAADMAETVKGGNEKAVAPKAEAAEMPKAETTKTQPAEKRSKSQKARSK